jgi:hypothetical protein
MNWRTVPGALLYSRPVPRFTLMYLRYKSFRFVGKAHGFKGSNSRRVRSFLPSASCPPATHVPSSPGFPADNLTKLLARHSASRNYRATR